MVHKIVVCGAGFIGSSVAKTILAAHSIQALTRRVQISSRRPQRVYESLKNVEGASKLLDPVAADVTKPDTLVSAFRDAHIIVSLVGLLYGTTHQFEEIQWRGAENVAKACNMTCAKLIHFSAIGADEQSKIPYARTKALAEKSVLEICPDATIIRPSIVFGPGDGFFGRFARLSKFLPFLPVFGGGRSRVQPVFVGDLGRAVEIISRDDPAIRKAVAGKILEAGGPEVFTYRQAMQLVLRYSHRSRPIISLPFAIGTLQAVVLEQFPPNIFTLTRSQVEQLKLDNIVNPHPPSTHVPFKTFVELHSSKPLTSVHDILPGYL